MGTNSSKVDDIQQVTQVTQVTKPNTEETRQTTQTRQMMNELESDFNAIEAKKKSILKDNPQNPHKKVSYDEIQIYRHKYMPKSKTSADV